MDLQLKKEQLKSSLQSLQQQEIAIAKELEDKYGQGSISLETGEFLPSN
jgi:stress response protein YsnF